MQIYTLMLKGILDTETRRDLFLSGLKMHLDGHLHRPLSWKYNWFCQAKQIFDAAATEPTWNPFVLK